MDDDALSLETVRRRSPLKPDAISRVLEAPGLPLRIQIPTDDGALRTVVPIGLELEAIKLTLAAVADLCASYRIQREPLPTQERAKVSNAFITLMQGLATSSGTQAGAPIPPFTWFEQMVDWTSKNQEQAPVRRGRPVDLVEPKIYRLLLSVYEATYDVAAGTGAGGPTSRFLYAFFSEMHQQFRNATYVGPGLGLPDLTGLFSPPSLDTIRNKIRQYKDYEGRSEEVRFIIGFCRIMHENLGAESGFFR